MSDPLPVPNVLRFSGYTHNGGVIHWQESIMYPMWVSSCGPGDRPDPGGCIETSTATNKSFTTMQRAYGKALIKKIKENNHGSINGFMGKD